MEAMVNADRAGFAAAYPLAAVPSQINIDTMMRRFKDILSGHPRVTLPLLEEKLWRR